MAAVLCVTCAIAFTGSPAAGQRQVPTAAQGATADGIDDSVHLNQIQVVGTHNSYHVEATKAEEDLRRQFIDGAESQLEYGHVPLAEQFATQKIRQIELDLFVDDQGGKYANPLIRQATGGGPYDPTMFQPGIKVLHVQDVDYHSNCLTLKLCLSAVKRWSDANPNHVPIAIQLELIDVPVPLGGFPFVVPDPWNGPAMDNLDTEIRSVFNPSDVITPDDIRGTHPTLDEAVRTSGWPTLAASRGKVLFTMDNGGGYRDTYLAGHPALQGREVFSNSVPGQPDGAFVKVNDSRTNVAYIQGLVSQGYVVRTRADSDTIEAANNDVTARDAAFASGAQWVSTDFPVSEYAQSRYGNDFVVRLPGTIVARCNPVNAPPGCTDALVETQPEPLPSTTTTTVTTPTTTASPTTPPFAVATTSTVPVEGSAGAGEPVNGSAPPSAATAVFAPPTFTG